MWLLDLFKREPVDNQLWRTEKSYQWKKLRQEALLRDSYTCQNPSCNKKQTKLRRMAVHHIDDASSNPESVLDIDNVTTLCHGKGKCHNRFHKWNGGFDKPCSMKDLQSWYFYEKSRSNDLFALLIEYPTVAMITFSATIILSIYTITQFL